MHRSLRLSALASLMGKLIYAVSSLVVLPFYIRLLGPESVGLFGFFTTILMMFMAVEGGLSSSFTRELARCARFQGFAPSRYKSRLCCMANTYFSAFIGVGVAVSAIVFCLAFPAATYWLDYHSLSVGLVIDAIRWMGIFIGLNFVVIIVQAGLIGRERQLELNYVYIPYSILRTFGALTYLLILEKKASIEDFFIFQGVVQMFYVIALIVMFYKDLGKDWWAYPVRISVLSRGLRFGTGVLFISLSSVAVVQFDKLYLSGTIPLDEYGIYTLAVTFASIPYVFSSALYSVLFPRFSACISTHRVSEVANIFQSSFLGFIILFVPLVLASWWFSSYPLMIFFQDMSIVTGVAHIFPVLLSGTAIQSLLIVPFALQLSVGWTSLALKTNLLALPFIFVALPFAVNGWGSFGAACVWLLYNLFSFFVTTYFMVKRFPFLVNGFVVACKVFICLSLLLLSLFSILDIYLLKSFNQILALITISLSSLSAIILAMWFFRKRLAGFY